jgi:deoxyribonuclease-2
MSVVLLLAVLTLAISKSIDYACRDPNNNIVDWYLIMLFPSTANHADNSLVYMFYDEKSGLNQYYFDIKTFPPIRDTHEVENSSAQSKVNYFFWNDDTSTEKKLTAAYKGKAHSKGGLVYNRESGYFLMHSLPRFPRRTADNKFVDEFPDNAGKFAQHFLCISTDFENNLKIIDTLNIINPQLIVKNGEEDNVSDNESVLKLIKNRSDPKLPPYAKSTIESVGKKEFTFFSRSKNEEHLQYDFHIPQHYGDNFYVETWTKPKLLDPICNGKYKIMNIKSLKFGLYAYNNNQEHAKWSVAEKKDISCFGDLNRTDQKTIRGGNVICISDKKLANIMRDAITDADQCNSKLAFLE